MKKMSKMHPIHMSRWDIILGLGGSPRWCPIAKVIRRTVPGKVVAVHGNEMSINGNWYDLPDELQDFIEKFDACPPPFSWLIKPIEFELEIID